MTPAKAPLPMIGTWKLTKCESSRPDLPHPISGTTTFAQEQDGIRYRNAGVWSDGRTSNVHALIRMDGSWCPITGSLVADEISVRLLDDGSMEATTRKGGNHTGSVRSAISSDGKTQTGQWEMVGPGGEKVTWKTTSTRV